MASKTTKQEVVLYLDCMYIKLCRDVVGKEVIYFALGVTEDGYREILGFYVGGQESALGWREMLQDLYTRGVQEVLLGVFDGLPGLEEAFIQSTLKQMSNVALSIRYGIR